MSFVYHRRPVGFQPPVLYPLNDLAARYPEAHRLAAAKYATRRPLMSARIPLLDCLWNDAIHCAPLHPTLIYRALVAAGAQPEPGVAFFEIPIEHVVRHPSVILDFSSADGTSLDVNSVQWLDAGSYRQLARVPEATIDYYRREVDRGRRPLLFAHIPHVLVRAALDTTPWPIVLWDRA